MYKTVSPFLNFLINHFFITIFLIIFFTYIKIHQLNIFKITKIPKKFLKDIKVFLKKKKKIIDIKVVNDKKNLPDNNNQNWLNIEKNMIK